jgi:hypothetical protein
MWRLVRRWRTALALFFLPGDRTPVTRQDLVELRRDWATWESTFSDILEKLSMQYARQRKREQRNMAQLAGGASAPTEPESGRARKLSLYRRAAAASQGALALDMPPPPAPDEDEE